VIGVIHHQDGASRCRFVQTGAVILESLELTPDELLAQTGWELKPEGACKDDRCVPLPDGVVRDGIVDIVAFADRLAMPIARDDTYGLSALGPESGGHVLASTTFPELVLADFNGNAFDFADLRGRKALLVAWASY
jgi:hypothetical protein